MSSFLRPAPVKPGVASSEWWLVLLTAVLTFVGRRYGVPEGEVQGLVDALARAVPEVAAVVAQAVVVWGYVKGRTELKRQALVTPAEPLRLASNAHATPGV